MKTKVLVLDDEKEIADLLTLYLENEDYEVFTCYDAKTAIACIQQETLDIALLDIMVPDIDGLSICTYIRKTQAFPIIMITAKGENDDKIEGLTLGADDYITKPFQPLEVMARVKAQLRRYHKYNLHKKTETGVYEIHDLRLDEKRHSVTLQGEALSLTPIEFSILNELCKHQGDVISSEELFERVWKEKYFDSNNTIMVHIRRLREKMKEDTKHPRYIKTVWGIGYCIDE